MTYQGKTVNNELIDLGQPVEIVMNQSADVPADDLELTLLCSGPVAELKEIYIIENSKNFFSGIVDTQSVSIDNSGIFLNITARSKAALLLDNEAIPQTYYVPSLFNIFNRHIKPYGFTAIVGDTRTFSNEFVVSKGMSEWEVLENFCADYLKVYPRINSDGTINATGEFENNSILFSNSPPGIKYSAIYENLKRYELFSEVDVKATTLGTYSTVVKDNDIINRGIVRRRLLNAVNNNKTPVSCGEIMLSTGAKNSYEICIFCPGSMNLNIGDKATVNDSILGVIENLVVSEIKYTLNKNGEQTKVLLRKEI